MEKIKIGGSFGITKNLGDFEFIRSDHSLEVTFNLDKKTPKERQYILDNEAKIMAEMDAVCQQACIDAAVTYIESLTESN